MHKRLILIILGLLLITAAAYAQEIPTVTPIAPTPATAVEEVAGGMVDVTEGAATALTDTAVSLWDRLLQPPSSEITRLILVVGGIILLVAGWVVYDYIILIAGFLIGGVIALSLVVEPNSFMSILFFLIGGLIGAALAAFIWYLAVFLIGAYIGIALIRSVSIALGFGIPSDIVLLIALAVGGAILLVLSSEVLILFSAIVGAQMLALGFGLGADWVILLAILGVVVQFAIMRSRGIVIRRRPRSLLWRSRPAT